MANVDDAEFQDPQDLVARWADNENDLDALCADPRETRRLHGGYDAQLTVDVEDDEMAFAAVVPVERYWFEVHTMRALPIDRIGEVVEDVRPGSAPA